MRFALFFGVVFGCLAGCDPTTTPATTPTPTTTVPTTAKPMSAAPAAPTAQVQAQRAFAFLEPAMGSCFGVAPNAHGTLTVLVEIGPAGAVQKVDFAPSSTLTDTGVRACIATAISKSTDFGDPGAGGNALVSTTLQR